MSMTETDASAGKIAFTQPLPCTVAWDPATSRAMGVTISTLAALLLLAALQGYSLTLHLLMTEGRSFIDNYFPFWSWSRFIHDSSVPARIYQFPVINAFQRHLDHAYHERLPFAYPPSFMLLIWPLGLLSRFVGYGVFLGGSLMMYVAACWHRTWGRQITIMALIAPSTVLAIYYAQSSLLVAALMIAGCRLTGKRPILAGVLFGLVSFKPQFGLLIPVALVSAREWRSFATAAVTVLAGVVASGAAFGWATWAALPAALTYLARFVASGVRFNDASPTVAATLRLLGSPPAVTHIGQLVAAAVVGGTVLLCFRRGFRKLPVAILLVGTFFTTPYAFFYDLPIISYAVLAICLDARERLAPLKRWEIAALTATVLLPYLMLYSPLDLPYGGIVLVVLFVLVIRRIMPPNLRRSFCVPEEPRYRATV